MPSKRISVLSVSWYSADYLRDLIPQLLALADQPETLQFLIADNSGGADRALDTLDFPDLTIEPVDVQGQRMSMAHGTGINALLPHVGTPYVLITDPDVALFRRGWDTLFIEAMETQETVALGAPYPPWKLGKYHDFPSPPFAFWHTDRLKALDPDWTPYARTALRRLVDFALRQSFWLPRLLDRHLLRLTARHFRAGRMVERLTGVVSKDTGWEIADRARKRGWRANVFDVLYTAQDLAPLPDTYTALAQEFELYAWHGEPVLSHRNPTLTRISFNLWTHHNIILYQDKTDKAAQTARWRTLTGEIAQRSSAGPGE